MIAKTPEPPYYVVVFTIVLSDDLEGYEKMAITMVELAHQQPGFLGMEYGADAVELTISYWDSLEAIQSWRMHTEHVLARQAGRERWFKQFKVRIAKVERDYSFDRLI